MGMNDIINLIVNNGMSIVIIAYFIYKDNSTQKNMIETLQEIREVLMILKER